MPVEEACEYVRQAAEGLQHAHERGLVHRDIKPGNLLLTPRGRVKIVDFGLARLLSTEGTAGSSSSGVLGSPDYISPEQARDPADADARSDLYSLGCTLYFLLAGRPPFPRGSALQKLLAHRERRPRPVRELRPEVPPEVAELLDRMLAKRPADRPATAAEVVPSLGSPEQRPGRRPARRGKRWAPAAALLVGAAAVGLSTWPRGPGKEDAGRDTASAVAPPDPGTDRASAPPLAAPGRERPGSVRVGVGPRPRLVAREQPVGAERAHRRPDGRDDRRLGGRLGRLPVDPRPGAGQVGPAVHRCGAGGEVIRARVGRAPKRTLSLEDRHYYLRRYPGAKGVRAAKPTVELSDLRIENADGLPRGRRVRGTVAYRRTGTPGTSPHLRMVHYPGVVRTTGMFYLREQGREERGTIAFDFGAMSEKHATKGIPLVAFMEFASGGEEKITIESNTLATIVWLED